VPARLFTILGLVAGVSAAALPSAPARASFPGRNGKIAFARDRFTEHLRPGT
jgi:hypothetical protein